MKKKLAIFVLSQFLLAGWADAQQAYFIDGYHGGIYGHYPVGQTAFIAQKLRQNPNWNINIEIEPESWKSYGNETPKVTRLSSAYLRINPWRAGGSST